MKKSAVFTTTLLIITGLMGMSGCNTVSERDRGEIAKAALLYAQTEPAEEIVVIESEADITEEPEESAYDDLIEDEEPVIEEPRIEEEVAFKAVDKYVSTTRNYIVRSGASNHTESLWSFEGGDEVHVTGESENGIWYRVEINGEEGYIRSSVFETESTEEIIEETETTTAATEAPVAPSQTTETTAAATTTVIETVVEAPAETAAPTPTPVPAPAVAQYAEVSAYELLDMINSYRAENGLGALSWSQNLAGSAYIRANECVVSFSHTRPDGSEWWTSGNPYAENIACGSGGNASFQALFNSWVNSDGHRANMLNPDYHTIGCSAVNVDGVLYAVQHFGY